MSGTAQLLTFLSFNRHILPSAAIFLLKRERNTLKAVSQMDNKAVTCGLPDPVRICQASVPAPRQLGDGGTRPGNSAHSFGV